MNDKKSKGFFARLWNLCKAPAPVDPFQHAGEEPLFHFELFSFEQREQHGKALAGLHRIRPGRSRDRLLARLDANEKRLLEVHRLLIEDVEADRSITAAGEWVLDNFYIIEEQIRMARRHLPKGYSRELPHLANTASAGLPRIYDIAQTAISHGDGRADAQRLGDLVAAYQNVTPLGLGELWAIPIMLRLALIENISKIAAFIITNRAERLLADHWAERLTRIASEEPKNLIVVLAELAQSNVPPSCSFVSEFSRRLRDQGPALAFPLDWVEQQLADNNLTTEQLLRQETQLQLTNQISMGNCIGSLRALDAMDWREFVENTSVVQRELSGDPAGIYAKMDFHSRDRYRHVIEKTAKYSPESEPGVARKAIELARQAAETYGKDDRRAHVGYYLIDQGRPALEKSVGVRVRPFQTLARSGRCCGFPLYLGAIGVLTVLLTWFLASASRNDAIAAGWILAVVPALLLGAAQLAVALVNWLASLLVKPQPLPRMDYSKGVPPERRTLVVVPAMLTDAPSMETLWRDMEVRFLANQDRNIRFALLTDFHDAAAETEPGDAELLQRARKRTNALNQKYQSRDGDRFFLFHRPRRWNPREGVWMGYERKRGKLADLNAFLRGRCPEDRFSLIVGDTAVLSGVQYVITLDADTKLPRDCARELIGTLAHPLNRAVYDASLKRVVEGYGILQPRVSTSMSSADRSIYARIFSGAVGIDPYTRATSDVYQDLFGEGSFIGKGIYDIDAFERTLDGRFPENRILSHDLLEGCHARSGLVSDVHLYETYPDRYVSDVARRHRWIRGDWQIARWALNCSDRISFLSRWKILDNLRRSLTPAALVLILLFGWLVSGSPWFWTFVVLGILLIPPLAATLSGTFRKPEDTSLKNHLIAVLRAAPKGFVQALFGLATLPFEAFYSLDAVVRVLWRMTVSHRLLLQWRPSAEADRQLPNSLAGYVRTMWCAPLASVVLGALLPQIRPGALIPATCVLALWLCSPLIAWSISRPRRRRGAQLSAAQINALRKIARKIWLFFETFVGPDDHWLPPDNYQEHPVARIAHRTSPTNIGLSLLANLAAYDFGTISLRRLVDRTRKTLETMSLLERHEGHFYNWYDTRTLHPLPPRYISSVDSGNLAGHLVTLRSGLRELGDRPILSPRVFDSLNDALGLAEDAWNAMAGDLRKQPLKSLRENLDAILSARPDGLNNTAVRLALLEKNAMETLAGLKSLELKDGNRFETWLREFEYQCRDAREELGRLAPWTASLFRRITLLEFPELDRMPTVRELAALEESLAERITERKERSADADETAEWDALGERLAEGTQRARTHLTELELLAGQCTLLSRMEYDFLYDETRHLLSIGYNVDAARCDAGYYDLLASEARLACFVGIAQGALPQESWFALSRILTTAAGRPVLLSWSGSMFEYLMPLLIMPTYDNTLLDDTMKTAVARQIEYGKKRRVPWGISESGYYIFDAKLDYQYRAFGVPGLGLTRGLASDLVIAPYATVMSLTVAPKEAAQNLARLSSAGFEGDYGFYEAIDYTTSRIPRGQPYAVIRSFMAHHQGMSLLALAYRLLDRPMQKRFAADPAFQATLLLLQEKNPETTVLYAHTAAHPELKTAPKPQEMSMRVFTTPETPHPEVQLLSNGNYHVMVGATGAGYSRWGDLAVTRWREDATRDHWGSFIYLRDVGTGQFWSTAFQPTLRQTDRSEVVFLEGRAEFHGTNLDYETRMDVVVSPEDDIELRRVRITNRAKVRRSIEITGYAEIVLAPMIADALHPAFSKLFVQTEILPQQDAILGTRRPRAEGERTPYMINMITVHGTEHEAVSCETDRLEFLGRNGSTAAPRVMTDTAPGSPLAGNDGAVLDPIVALRTVIALEPGQSVDVDWALGVGETRDAVLRLLEKYRDRYVADRAFDMAWTHGHVLLEQVNATESDALLYNRLAGSILYANRSLRASENVLAMNRRGQSGLWGYSISGDYPIVLLKIEDQASLELVRSLLKAHEYWHFRGLDVDLVIWNEDQIGYRQQLNDQIMELITAGSGAHRVDRPGGVFLRSTDRIAEEDRVLIQAVARIILSDTRGSLADQIDGFPAKKFRVPALVPTRKDVPDTPTPQLSPRSDLIFSNGWGGFTQDGREYVITTDRQNRTPAPWVNVMANPDFGTVVSESGAASTWSENAHEFRLTPWENDPVTDACGEAFYLRDEETGGFWSPMPWPRGGATPYVSRHGFGYSVFEHTDRGIYSETAVYVAVDAPVKFVSIRVRNVSGHPRKLSATGCVEWILGDLRSKTAMNVVTEIDPGTEALFARNSYTMEFPDRTAFFDVDDSNRSVTCDRREFLGRNGDWASPAAMKRSRLSGKVGAGLDPCAAIKVDFELADGEDRTITFRLGVGLNWEQARNTLIRFRGQGTADALKAVWHHWPHVLGAINVESPDPAFNVLANGWLLYQTLSCRFWGRNATYQSGGAFGFRDQLQDSMALIYSRPDLVREHLLRCAEHQFVEGDVLHWWHPPMERGVRTLCSDDYLWLPSAVQRYVEATGDTGILDETVRYIEGRPLREGEESYYDLPTVSRKEGTLYDHCVRAIEHGLRFGAHGLPLMGSGDWNDGMDMVGREGRGESVWLGFFLYDVLVRFGELAVLHKDEAFGKRCKAEAETLRRNLNEQAWDGSWYRRAYFDDGTPLGSVTNPECKIDSIVQSWSVLSGAGDPERSRTALRSLDQHLVRRKEKLIQLFDPPFDFSSLNPGYIKGYVPGVRENGGQYTHAAVWAVMAFARSGDRRKAWELLDLINPVRHADSREAAEIYKVEPYVVAADVYASPRHVGRGGWTWYTGSAAWMYRLMMESLLGLRLERNRLRFAPCLPESWEKYHVHYRFRETVYHITFIPAAPEETAQKVTVDGISQEQPVVDLTDDRREHWVEVVLPDVSEHEA